MFWNKQQILFDVWVKENVWSFSIKKQFQLIGNNFADYDLFAKLFGNVNVKLSFCTCLLG